MTIDELLEKIKASERAGKIVTSEDSVFVRDPNVSQAAIDAGSSPWIDVEEILVVPDDNSEGLPAGIYLQGEDF
jgi:hypothetical protein